MLSNLNIHPSWNDFLSDIKKEEIRKIGELIGNNINPKKENVLRFFERDVDTILVVWLGQDPYPAAPIKDPITNQLVYVATGRSFEVGTLHSWTQPFKQHSLKNIVRLIYKTKHQELISYPEIKSKIENKEFEILPPHELFENLENQGVLFLNTSLTCEQGKPNSHKELWENFSKELIQYISSKNEKTNWFLWGGEAIKNKEFISKGRVFESNHPRLYDTEKEKSFLNTNCFEETSAFIDWTGKK